MILLQQGVSALAQESVQDPPTPIERERDHIDQVTPTPIQACGLLFHRFRQGLASSTC
jgi:hypothetical protein